MIFENLDMFEIIIRMNIMDREVLFRVLLNNAKHRAKKVDHVISSNLAQETKLIWLLMKYVVQSYIQSYLYWA